MTDFNYLEHILRGTYYNWPAVVDNMWNAQKKWTRMSRILVQEGTDARMSGKIFKVVMQEVLLFGSETWVETPHMGRTMGGF